jgi:YidC/Oxa1 family membrane protein insertase
MWLLGIFHAIFRDWGLAIIALVFIVRAVLHPITKKSQINMAKMAKMGPEIERIKKKYGDDKEALNRAMLEFYKNHGATPILGCLPMFLQMPIWISLYSGLSTTFELRHAPFLYGLTWIKDLSKPDHLIEFDRAWNFLFIHIDGLNVIPILLAVAFYLQYKLQPKPPVMTEEQKSQQRMMMWMTTLLFPLMLYPMPSGLNIYIFASTIFGVIESKIIRNHIEKQEALKPTGPQFVDGEVVDSKPVSSSRGGVFGWFARLQERAEALRQEAEKKARQKRK